MTTELYKKDSKGKIRVWRIEAKGDSLTQWSGLLDGKLVPNTKLCTPKNKGKANETSGSQQALLELESSYKTKLDEGYVDSVKKAESNTIILPMLAKSYNDEKHKIDWKAGVYVQPKLDGMRALWTGENLISRQGKVITTLDHIVSNLRKIKGMLDGEVYAHGKSFQENMRLLKKYRPGETEEVKYHVYDSVSDDSFDERYIKLTDLVKGIPQIKVVHLARIHNEQDLVHYHQEYLTQGYEGTIIRHGKEGYQLDKRSSNLLKYKDFQDIACKIVDISPADQRPEWGVPTLEHGGKTFQAGMKFSHDERKDFLKNKKKYIGKTAEIRFFEYSEDGIPRFPVMVGIRLDK